MLDIRTDLANLGIPEEEWASYLFDFDIAVMEWWEWFSSQRKEQRQRRLKNSEKLKDSHTWVPKYTDRDILDMYMAEADAPDPVAAAIDDEQFMDFMDAEWIDEDVPDDDDY